MMTPKEQIEYLLKEYCKDKYATSIFVSEFNKLYDLEMDYSLFSEQEYELMKELAIVTGRFSPFEEDMSTPNAYFNETEVKKKAKDVYLKIF